MTQVSIGSNYSDRRRFHSREWIKREREEERETKEDGQKRERGGRAAAPEKTQEEEATTESGAVGVTEEAKALL